MTDTERIRALSVPNGWRWGWLAGLNWLEIIVILASARILDRWWAYALAMPLLATRQHALTILGHEATHFLACQSRSWNDLLGELLTLWPFGLWLKGYRDFHFRHHRGVGTNSDPELLHRRRASRSWELPMPIWRIVVYSVRDILGYGVLEIARVNLLIKRKSLRDKLGPIGWWVCALMVMRMTHSLWLAAIWWASFGTYYWAFFRVRTWSEHLGTNRTHRCHFNGLQRFFFAPNYVWNHYEHHRWPSIPAWNLPQARLLDSSIPILGFSQLFKNFNTLPSVRSGEISGSPGVAQTHDLLHASPNEADQNLKNRG